MRIDSDKYAIVVIDREVLDKVVNLVLDSGTEFRVVQQGDTNSSWVVTDLLSAIQYEDSEWDNSGR